MQSEQHALTECRWRYLETLPVHPKPQTDESLAGYVWRLMIDNRLSTRAALRTLCVAPAHRRVDGDGYITESMVALANLAGLDMKTMEALTFLSLIRKFKPFDEPARPRFARALEGMLMDGQQVCPICLREGAYLRKMWRLCSVTICVRHHVWLVDRCSGCGNALQAGWGTRGYLECEGCRRRWGEIGTRAASNDEIALQSKWQDELAFLCDTDAGLNEYQHEDAMCAASHRELLAQKYRHLVRLTGLSTQRFAQKHRLATVPYKILQGREVPVIGYIRCLAALGVSWHQFAALDASRMPPARNKVATNATKHVRLRVCPTAGCQSATSNIPEAIKLKEDWPTQQVARFECLHCGRIFMRCYDGTLHFRNRGLAKRIVRPKAKAQLTRAERLGRSGCSDADVDARLGWEVGTAKAIWLQMAIYEEVRAAQAEVRFERRRTELRLSADKVLGRLMQSDAAITLKEVMKQLGHSEALLRRRQALHTELRRRVAKHNERVGALVLKQLRQEFECYLDKMATARTIPTIEQLARALRRKAPVLECICPDLYQRFKRLRAKRQRDRQNRQIKDRLQSIEKAAKKMSAEGSRMSKLSILRCAKLSTACLRFPVINQSLAGWTAHG